MKLRIKNTKLTIQIISWLQIVGGIFGLGLVAYLMLHTGTINGIILLIFLIGIALYIYSIYAGKKLLMDENKQIGIILSIINQALQLFQWSLFGYEFLYSSGAAIVLGIQGNAFNFQFAAIISKFEIAINSDDGLFFKINILALIIIVVLVSILKEIGTKKIESKN